MPTGSDADAISASYAQGVRDGRAQAGALQLAAQELWNAVAHDVIDESKWVGKAMAKVQAVLALPADGLAEEVVWLLKRAIPSGLTELGTRDWCLKRDDLLARLGGKP